METIDPEEGVMKITGISPGTAYLTIASEELGTRVVGVTVGSSEYYDMMKALQSRAFLMSRRKPTSGVVFPPA